MAGAAAFSSALINEPEADNEKVLSVIWKSGLKSWRKRFIRFKTKVRNGAYPAHIESFWVIMSLVTMLHLSDYKIPYDLVKRLIGTMSR